MSLEEISAKRPISQACENNKDAILRILRSAFAPSTKVLEIGSGTGQHAVYFAEHLSHLVWQTSDRPAYHAGIKAWLASYNGSNAPAPLRLDVEEAITQGGAWPNDCDAVFSANTAHIMSWDQAQMMIAKVAQCLPEQGVFALYGPFNYQGSYTSQSNASFDQWLKQGGEHQAIRDQEAVVACANTGGLELICDHTMPANNRLLVFKKLNNTVQGGSLPRSDAQ